MGRSRPKTVVNLIYRTAPALAALCLFLVFTAIYAGGHQATYLALLRLYGIDPFRSPFLDISGVLAAWDCTRLGLDVVVHDSCDVLGRAFNNSPFWVAGAFIPLGRSATGILGWILGLCFILSLPLMPSARRPKELVLTVLATVSTMVVFAVERANPDLIVFMLALFGGFLALGALPARLLTYAFALFAALLKYYPLTLLILSLRERARIFIAVNLAVFAAIVFFIAFYLADLVRGIPLIPSGLYFADRFAAKNLPFGLAGIAASPNSPLFYVLVGGLYLGLLLAVLLICRRLLTGKALGLAFARLPKPESIFLTIGSALIVGCFFTGQSIGYRGIFLLFVLPGLLAMARDAADPVWRKLCARSAIVLVLVMWGEFFRTGLAAVFYLFDNNTIATLLFIVYGLLWFARELAWWWLVSVMTAILIEFALTSQTVRGVLRLSRR
jgi:hypothetical protein